MDNGNTGLALIVGGLVVIVALFFVFGGFPFGGGDGPDRDVDVSIEAPQVETPG
jgi:hypothetical protein